MQRMTLISSPPSPDNRREDRVYSLDPKLPKSELTTECSETEDKDNDKDKEREEADVVTGTESLPSVEVAPCCESPPLLCLDIFYGSGGINKAVR